MSDKPKRFKVLLPDWDDRMREQFVESSGIHCPDCGKDGCIWEYDEDYDAGTKYICIDCHCVFYMAFATEKHAEKIATAIKAKAGI